MTSVCSLSPNDRTISKLCSINVDDFKPNDQLINVIYSSPLTSNHSYRIATCAHSAIERKLSKRINQSINYTLSLTTEEVL
jgi:hypothetical protein